MSKNGYEHFRQLVAEIEIAAHCEPYTMSRLSVFRTANEIVYFGWDFIKWYPSLRDISAIEAALKQTAEDGWSYRFSRIGEEIGDFETDEYNGETDEDLFKSIYPPSVTWSFDDEYNFDDIKCAGGR